MIRLDDQERLSEQQLIEGCLRGDQAAQRALYAQTVDPVYRLLLRMTQDPETAADLTQDTYIRVFQNLDRFEGASSLSTWIYRIAVNEAQQYFRRRKRHDELLREELPRPAEAETGEQETTALRIDVRAALERLPEEERTLIVLRYFEGLDYARIAEVVGKPAGTVASGLNRARRMLEAHLGTTDPPD
ncbi:MAG TPA: sigma-70 family RNA polymerase sigma factor [Phycisphaerae bacterium]|nr:sigma-70 family RNA polymerase sigma factor [Phycisphaerae bacterium]